MKNEDIFNFMNPIIPIKNKKEFDELIEEYKKLMGKEKYNNYQRYEEIRRRLNLGILIEDFILIDKVIQTIVAFLKKYGFDGEFFYNMLKNTTFSITSLKTMFGSIGLAQSTDKNVYFDISIIEFDENGNFEGIKSENLEKISHILFHELFHRISASRDDKPLSIWSTDTALSEGFTDFFAEELSGFNGPQKSKNYQFSKDICNIFSEILGMKNVLDDYLNHLTEYPTLRKLFKKYNLSFDEFVTKFDRLLSKRLNKLNENEIIEEENSLLIFLRDSLIIPYIEDNPDKSQLLTEKFNLLFENRNISIPTKNKAY